MLAGFTGVSKVLRCSVSLCGEDNGHMNSYRPGRKEESWEEQWKDATPVGAFDQGIIMGSKSAHRLTASPDCRRGYRGSNALAIALTEQETDAFDIARMVVHGLCFYWYGKEKESMDGCSAMMTRIKENEIRCMLQDVDCPGRGLTERETFTTLVDREQQLLSEHLIGRVLGQVDLVET